MRILSRKRLRQFWQTPNHKASEGPLQAWYQHVKQAQWRKFSDVKADFPSADKVGSCVVFNLAGNKYRLITWIRFISGKVFIRHVLTHKQYDEGNWKSDCGPPPPKLA